MNYQQIPELQGLLSAVEKKYGRPVLTTNDFNTLSAIIRFEGREVLSPSTLKRLWGYVSHKTTPRKATLDVLARFVGYKDFSDYRMSLLGEQNDTSAFLETYYIAAEDIADGGLLTIGWEPNRVVRLRKVDSNWFEVLESRNSKLREGDRFQCPCFFKGLPLVIPTVSRGSQILPSYIAGKTMGLNLVELES